MEHAEFYHLLGAPVINNGQRSQLLEYAEDHSRDFYLIPYGPMTSDGNQLLRIGDETQLPWLSDLRTSMPLPVTAFVLVKHSAYCKVIPHRDRDSRRSSVIATALTPIQGYADTVFWRGGKIVARCVWDYQRSVILNTQETHSLENGAETRINFQICFRESIAEVAAAMLDRVYGTTVSLG